MSVETLPNLNETETPESELTPLPELAPEFIREHTLRFENNGGVLNLVPTFYKRGDKRKSCSWYLAPNPAVLTASDYVKILGEDEAKHRLATMFARDCQEAFEANEDAEAGTYDRNAIVAYLQRGPIRLKIAEIKAEHTKAANTFNLAFNEVVAKGLNMSPGSETMLKLAALSKDVSRWAKLLEAKQRKGSDDE